MNNYAGNQQFNQKDFGASLNDNEQQQYGQHPQQMQGGYPPQNMGQYGNPQMMQQNPMMQAPQFGMMQQPMMTMQPGMQQFAHPMQGQFMGGLGPQMTAPGQFAPPIQGGFQPMGQMQVPVNPAPQLEESKATEAPGAMKMASTEFNMNVTEFVPDGMFAKTEESFPGFDEDPAPATKKGKGKKGKKGGKLPVVAAAKVEEEVDANNAWKGKPSSFFVMKQGDGPSTDPQNPDNHELNDDQWSFVFEHYPQYGQAPYQIMIWIYGQVQQNEEIWAKPALGGGVVVEQEDDDFDPLSSNKADRAFNAQKQKSKKQSKADEEKKLEEAKAKQAAKLEHKGITQQQVDEEKAKKDKEKAQKKFKDVAVNMKPDELVEVDTVRQPCSMVFIGHVDAGKSTICGNLMYMAGVIDDRTIEKFKEEAKAKGRDSWWLAYVMDISDDEKAKGKTVEVGRATFDTPSKKYTIFDAPGHKNYVPNMITGASMADVGGLVISARKGEFEAGFEKDGQTREHAQLAKSLGIQRLIIIVNKMDEAKWGKGRYDEIYKGLKPFLNETGYADKDLVWIPVAGLSGENLDKPVDPKLCSWYKGPCFMEVIDKIQLDPREANAALRIPIMDKMRDSGITIFGKVESGTVRLGDKLAIAPTGQHAQVVQLLDGKEQVVMYAGPGENVKIKVNVAEDDHIQKGYVLCDRENPAPATDLIEADVEILEIPETKRLMTKGYSCMMHIHTWSDDIFIKDIVRSIEKAEKEGGEDIVKEKPKYTKSFTRMICRIQMRGPVCLEKFDEMAQMGRFTLRDEGRTIALGKILKYKPHKGTTLAAE